MPRIWIILFPVYPDDSGKELATVLSYLAGRSLSREEIWTAMELPRSTYYDQLDKGTLITADNLRVCRRQPRYQPSPTAHPLQVRQPEETPHWLEEIAAAPLCRTAQPPLGSKTVQPTKIASRAHRRRPRSNAICSRISRRSLLLSSSSPSHPSRESLWIRRSASHCQSGGRRHAQYRPAGMRGST